MMDIQDKNETIAQITYSSIRTNYLNAKTLTEFGFFNYYIESEPETGDYLMAFNSPDFKKLFEFSGKEFIEKEFKDYTYLLDQKLGDKEWPIVLKASMAKYLPLFKIKKKEVEKLSDEDKKKREEMLAELEKYAKETSEKFSKFRVQIYASVMDKMLLEVKEKKNPKLFSFFLNKDNLLHILPSNDRIQLIYGINFQQETDKSLAKIFLQELEEAKRHVRNCLDAKVYVETSNIPQYITKVDQAKNYSNGLVVFDLFAKDYEQIKKKFFYFVNFRQYIQFHIHSIKTFLHIRMNRKGKEIENKLSGCKIIPDEYIKELETLNFYVNWNKKEEQKKIFTSEVKKLNV